MYDLARSNYKKTDGVLPISVSFCFSGLFQKNHVQSEISPSFSSSSWVSITSPLVLPELPGDFLSALVRWCTGRVAALAEGLCCEWPCAAAGWAGFGERGVRKKKNVSLLYNVPFGLILIAGLLDCLLDCLMDWLLDRLLDCLIDRLIACLIACLLAWLLA